MTKKIIINFYVTYKCNLSCSYCNVYDNFSKENNNLDIFFSDKFHSFLNYFNDYDIIFEFFGGEPLLKGDFIRKFCDYYGKKFSYKITTNGLLLNSGYSFLDDILLSVHHYSISKLVSKLNNGDFNQYNGKISFTFVIDKDNIDIFYYFSDVLYKNNFFQINILPVFGEYDWSKEKLKKLSFLINNLKSKGFILDFLGYVNNKRDYEFSLDINGNISAFNGEYIYNENLKNKFNIGNFSNFNNEYYDNIFSKFNHLNKLNLEENAKICNVYGKQTSSNFFLLNSFLIFYKNKFN